MKPSLLSIAAALVLLTPACGPLQNVLDEANEEADAFAASLAVEQADLALETFDLIGLDEETESNGEGENDPAALAPPGSLDGALAAAPGDGGLNVEKEYYGCDTAPCRVKTASASRTLNDHRDNPLGTHAWKTTFHYHSAITDAMAGGEGDLDLTSAGPAYVRADYTITHTFARASEDSDLPLDDTAVVTTGYRVWSTHRGEWYVVDAGSSTTGFPARPDGRVNVTAVDAGRLFAAPDTTDTSGHASRVVTFSDGTTDSIVRTLAYDVTADTLSGGWDHAGRLGFHGVGAFAFDLQGTPLCRLDDTGTVSIDRDFPDSLTLATAPVSEAVEIVKDGLTTSLDGTLTLRDGTVLTRSLTRTQESPLACDAMPRVEARVFHLSGTTYRGHTIDLQEVRSSGAASVNGERTLADGGKALVRAVYSQGVLNLRTLRFGNDGNPQAGLQIVLHPNGDGFGRLVVLRPGAKPIRRNLIIENRRVQVLDEAGNPVDDAHASHAEEQED